MKEDLEIKPCPHCGSTDLGIGRGTEDREGYPTYVYCEECGAQGPWIYTRDKAVLHVLLSRVSKPDGIRGLLKNQNWMHTHDDYYGNEP